MSTDTAAGYVTQGEAYDRDMTYIPDRVTAEEGHSRDPFHAQDLDVTTWPVQPERYRLVAAVPVRGPTARSSCGSCSGSRT